MLLEYDTAPLRIFHNHFNRRHDHLNRQNVRFNRQSDRFTHRNVCFNHHFSGQSGRVGGQNDRFGSENGRFGDVKKGCLLYERYRYGILVALSQWWQRVVAQLPSQIKYDCSVCTCWNAFPPAYAFELLFLFL